MDTDMKKRGKGTLIAMILLVLTFLLTACGGGGDIVLNKTSLTLKEGESFVLEVTVPDGEKAEFLSSNEAVVSVDAAGKITALSPGTADVTVSAANKKAVCKVSVVEATETNDYTIELDVTEFSLTLEETKQLKATVKKDGVEASGTPIVWESTNEACVTVTNGLIEAVGVGEATITAAAFGKSAYCIVSVTEGFRIALDRTEADVHPGDTFTLIATTTEDGEPIEEKVLWTTDNAEVADVTEGTVTVKAEGIVKIKATAREKEAVCTVRVTDLIELSVDMSEVEFRKTNTGKTITVSLTVNGKEVPDADISFSSSDEAVVTVKNDKEYNKAEIRAVGDGSAVVTVSYRTALATVGVNVYDVSNYTFLYTKEDFRNIRNDLGGKYLLMNDIDFGGEDINDAATGANLGEFKGILDGNGYKIRNFGIRHVGEGGIFSALNGTNELRAQIRNIGFEFTMSPGWRKALFANIANNALVENVYVDAEIPYVGEELYADGESAVFVRQFGSNLTFRHCVMNVTVTGSAADRIDSETKFAVMGHQTDNTNNALFENCYVYGNAGNLFGKLGSADTAIVENVVRLKNWSEADFDGWNTDYWSIRSGEEPQLKILSPIQLPEKTEVVTVGGRMTIQPLYSEGKAIWTSLNPEIALVNEKGEVTGVSAGTAVITATCDGLTARIAVTIKNAYTLQVNAPEFGLRFVGDTFELNATVIENGEEKTDAVVEFSVSDSAVLELLKGKTLNSRIVKLLKISDASVTVVYGDESFTVKISASDVADYTPVYTVEEFKTMKADGNYLLMNDLDFGGAKMAKVCDRFVGVLDGNGFTVKNFKVDGTGSGLFGNLGAASASATPAEVRNIRFDFELTPRQNAGLFGKDLQPCVIENVLANVKIVGYDAAIGSGESAVFGTMMNNNVTIRRCIINIVGVEGENSANIANDAHFAAVSMSSPWSGGNCSIENCIVTGAVRTAHRRNDGGMPVFPIKNIVYKSAASEISVSDMVGFDIRVWAKDGSDLQPLAPVYLNSAELKLPLTGSSVALTANVSDVAWEVEDEKIVTFSDGLVTPVAVGKTVITASYGGFTAKCYVTVEIPDMSVTLEENAVGMKEIGGTYALRYNVAGGKEYLPTFTSSNPKVASVNEEGVVTALAEGTAVITAEFLGYSDICTINVIDYAAYKGISTKEEFLNAMNVEGGASGKYILLNDIDFAGYVFGKNNKLPRFKGVLEGNGFALKNFTVQEDSGNANMFDGMGASGSNRAVVRNITFDFTFHAGYRNFLFGNGDLNLELTNAVFKVNLVYSGSVYEKSSILSGIVNSSVFTNCIFYVTTEADANSVNADPNFPLLVYHNNYTGGGTSRCYVTGGFTKFAKQQGGESIGGWSNGISAKTDEQIKDGELYIGWNLGVWEIDETGKNSPVLKQVYFNE